MNGTDKLYLILTNQTPGEFLILIKKNLPLEILETKKDEVGNTLQILARFDEKTISITTLYAPNTDSPGFFNSTFRIMETWDTDFQIFLGDWNLVQDQENDTHGYLHVNNINAKNTVLDAKDNFDLVDPWRIKNTTKNSHGLKNQTTLLLNAPD